MSELKNLKKYLKPIEEAIKENEKNIKENENNNKIRHVEVTCIITEMREMMGQLKEVQNNIGSKLDIFNQRHVEVNGEAKILEEVPSNVSNDVIDDITSIDKEPSKTKKKKKEKKTNSEKRKRTMNKLEFFKLMYKNDSSYFDMYISSIKKNEIKEENKTKLSKIKDEEKKYNTEVKLYYTYMKENHDSELISMKSKYLDDIIKKETKNVSKE